MNEQYNKYLNSKKVCRTRFSPQILKIQFKINQKWKMGKVWCY